MPRTKFLKSTSFTPCGLVAQPCQKTPQQSSFLLLKRQISRNGRSRVDLVGVMKREVFLVFFVISFVYV